MLDMPTPRSASLAELTGAIRRRSKALRYKFAFIEAVVGDDDSCDPPMEKMEVTLRRFGSPRSTTILVVLWQDRWAWIDAREAGKRGWLWSLTAQGRIKGGETGKDLLGYIEQFNDLLPVDGRQPDERAANFWQKRLLTGPRPASGITVN